MRYVIMMLSMLVLSVTSAMAQVSIGIGLPGVSIGINLPVYPEFTQVPGYPVYYAPRVNSNFFFYDGMYWVYHSDNWYASSWYNGPWGLVDRYYVPLYVLRIPVRYYRSPPEYFRGWRTDAPPRWGDHWGNDWQQRRSGWDRWDRKSVPTPAPLPVYQRQYSGDRYPQIEQQPLLHGQNYRYQPRDTVVRQHYQERAVQKAPAPVQRGLQGGPQEKNSRQQDVQRSNPPQNGREDVQRSTPDQAPPQQRGPSAQDQRPQPQSAEGQREQQRQRAVQANAEKGKGASPEPRRSGQVQEKDRDKGEDRGQDRNK